MPEQNYAGAWKQELEKGSSHTEQQGAVKIPGKRNYLE